MVNRLKVIAVEQGKTNKLLPEKLGKIDTAFSRWYTIELHPSVETMAQIAALLEIDIKELLNSTK